MHPIIGTVSRFAGLAALVILTACADPNIEQIGGFDRVMRLSIDASADRAELEARYGGEIIVWHHESKLAILRYERQTSVLAPEQLAGASEPNHDVFQTPEVSAGGAIIWSGGRKAWGGGGAAASTFGANAPLWEQIRLFQAQATAYNSGRGVKVAVIDTGIELTHPAFVGRLAPATEWRGFVDGDAVPAEVAGGAGYGHGTGVAGVIVQVAPNVTLLPLRALGPDGSGNVDDVVMAVDWAVARGADIINLSLGATVPVDTLNAVTAYAAQRGVYMVSSAGNTGTRNVTYPAAQADTGSNDAKYRSVSVGSIDRYSKKSSFSTHGVELELVAPGEFVYTAHPGARSGYWSGTSFAAPMASGALALGLGQPHEAADDHQKLEGYLTSKTRDVSNVNPNFKLGKGLLDIESFLEEFAR